MKNNEFDEHKKVAKVSTYVVIYASSGGDLVLPVLVQVPMLSSSK
jgi:hypothetical protein